MAEALFDGDDHEIAHVISLDALGGGDMAHGLAVAAIEREGDTDFLRIVAGDLKTVGAPAQVRYRHSDRAIVPPLTASGMPMKKQTVDAHDAINALTIGGLAVPVVNPILLPVDRESDDVAARCQSGADCFLG